ncbi:hypothetical protein [Proteiniclasticum ruminis]|uniref:hypothetical protein n=1 Tax=Proteiniclasticum ruminis TaxID=398199 RepID=UPI00289E4AEA|nr:hypothetical protein [Proteiniclasticum ruminis]
MMEQNILTNVWNYFLSLEKDLDDTSRYIEPRGQENVHSFEFAKILVLSYTELESVFKILCVEIENRKCGTIKQYKEILLNSYPNIVHAEVNISRWNNTICPFKGWDKGPLPWWSAYVNVKHNRQNNFNDATYKNTIYALSALYVSIMYLSKITGHPIRDFESNYIESNYTSALITTLPIKMLPDFDTNFHTTRQISSEI